MEQSAAEVFWQDFLKKHATFAGILAIVKDITVFFFYGHFIKKAGQWIILAAGIVAETVLLFSAVWVTIANVAPDFVKMLLGEEMVATLSWLALLSFSVLPEIILFSAVIKTYQLWAGALRNWKQRWYNSYTIWALIYSPVTLCFCAITLVTIGSFVDTGGHAAALTGWMLVFRCLLGWGYGLIELVYASVGKQNHPEVLSVAAISAQVSREDITQVVMQQNAQLATQFSEQLEEVRNQLVAQEQQFLATITEMTKKATEKEQEFATVLSSLQATMQQQLVAGFAQLAAQHNQQQLDDEDSNIVDIDSYRDLSTGPSTDPNIPVQQVRQQTATRGATKPATKSASGSAANAKQKAQRILKKTPGIAAPDLAKKAGISRQYASKIIAELA